ncbi:TRAP transporter substrate-binding protein [Wenyingzhuangia sp. 2_MG-2023]|uniref:TRAP transporter substrate-binding protein n=1 Tax=Wenyingzhuangia sp. 2_MG-2023 TaxID=3062639 RepID=UPI0026E2B225|nr:TRAP transporter substrate-binding protein [Wenyingzhuangia sp. 2_MG-2023]MDO6737990.1 TRAP transporter substrate-binding protein [Wenyingzhuangia sp. 2_MG-2023]MDO6802657.1 TRAP transporter substrate-binding protein [Wenyingzhuangia sp. 1_MG-2023]
MRIFFYLIFIFLLVACSDLTGTKTLTLAHTLPISHPVHKGIVVFQKELAKISEGNLNVKIFPDGQLGGERETLELLQIGSISMTKVSAATMANFVPEYGAVSIPYVFKDLEHCHRVLEGAVGEILLEKGTERWLRGLCFYDAGSRSFYTAKKPIKTAEDVKGLKIRVMNDPTAIKMVSALGGSATPMAYGELYTALQQGVVDGAENNIPSFVTSRHFEVCKYYSLDQHTYIPDVLIIGTKTLSRLSEQEKAWVFSAAKKSVEAQKKFWQESVSEGLQILKEAGVEIYEPNKDEFREKTKSLMGGFKEESFVKLVKAIKNTK